VAHCAEADLRIISRLVELIGVPMDSAEVLPQSIGKHFNAAPHEVELAMRPLLKCLELFHFGEYPEEVVQVIVAYALSYHQVVTTTSQCMEKSQNLKECMSTICILMYIADQYVEDVHFCVSAWRRCGVRIDRKTVMSLLAKLEFSLSVNETEFAARLAVIQRSNDEVAKDGAQVVAAISDRSAGRSGDMAPGSDYNERASEASTDCPLQSQ